MFLECKILQHKWGVTSKIEYYLIKKIHLSGSDRHEDCQSHVCPARSQPNGPQPRLLPASSAPQRQSADRQEVTDGGRKLGQPTGSRLWTGEILNEKLNAFVKAMVNTKHLSMFCHLRNHLCDICSEIFGNRMK